MQPWGGRGPTSARAWSNVEIGTKRMMVFTGNLDKCLQMYDWGKRTVIEENSPGVPLCSGTSDVVYLASHSERIAVAGDVKCTFQVKLLNSVVLMVKICSTTPVVFNLAFKTSTVVACQ
jgi:hypothetical protein